MRIEVVGAGAVGCYYGALLSRAGNDVTFVLRRDYEAVRDGGLSIASPLGDFQIASDTAVCRAGIRGPAELAICSLKATALDDAAQLVAPAVGPETRILALMNGLGVEEVFADAFGGGRVFGGMAFVCVNRGDPGTVHHLDYGRVTVGHFGDSQSEVDELCRSLVVGGIDAIGASSLLRASVGEALLEYSLQRT
ncbi:MAG TPA: 2-dehydropantoate 2-reductase N-terminal domain-containing protein [Dehalococcoidia bacterium]|nr:2-dehydropantoate 2-reductase N-terminal domain-containing protein [Dehalococcoidia bacterium]